MKRRNLWWLVAGLAFCAPAMADLRIGFVDPRSVLAAASESKAGKQHVENMEKFAKDKRGVFAKEEEKLKTLQQSLQKDALTLSDTQKQQREKEFQEKVAAYRKITEEAEQEGRKKDAEFKSRLEEEIRKAVEEAAREEKMNLVLGRGEVLYTDTGSDLTEKVVKKLQAALQKLEVKDGGKKK